MLELKNIKKSYKTGNFKQDALKGVDLKFRKSEFVSILGVSGSGKTTLLNIVGGLDRYDSGDLIINDISTKKFKDRDWDAYRNNCVGFVFQSYNLIPHISVLGNVEMALTLSGVNQKKRRKMAMDALKEVGLKDHAHKKPNQLSGGQMQRVAIARALVNDPEIILADEPTGALDSKTSVQIMDLMKEIAKDRLVIMVTHNSEIAEEYSTRIIKLKDGEVTSDSNPVKKNKSDSGLVIKKTAMSFITALKLSFTNIKTKLGRTALIAFASSIGIIGIALIMSLSNGFQIQIDEFESKTLSSMPLIVTSMSMDLDESSLQQLVTSETDSSNDFPTDKVIYPFTNIQDQILHTNKITEEYMTYIKGIDQNYIDGFSMIRMTNLNILSNTKDGIKALDLSSLNIAEMPYKEDESEGLMEKMFNVLYGKLPTEMTEMVLVIDSKNRVDKNLLDALGFDGDSEEIKFEDILNKEFKLVLNDEYFKSLGEFFTINTDFASLYSSSEVTLKISGIARINEDRSDLSSFMSDQLLYSPKLLDYVFEKNGNSAIVKAQNEKEYNVLTGQPFDETTTKDSALVYLGAKDIPMMIQIYPKDFESKDEILNYLDEYNKDKDEADKVLYIDQAGIISSLSSGIMDAITVVLVAFSSISLIVSSIMIGIITYISVLERTKEIGILRALGARKKDITRVFNAETFIIGISSGFIGVIIAWLLTFPANVIIESLTDLPNVAKLNPVHALVLIIVALVLTLIGGFIPAKMASKKDPVVALRTE